MLRVEAPAFRIQEYDSVRVLGRTLFFDGNALALVEDSFGEACYALFVEGFDSVSDTGNKGSYSLVPILGSCLL